MLPAVTRGAGKPTLFFLHFLGGSGREWTSVIGRLEQRYCCVAIDLPGFGDAADVRAYSVEEMADAVAEVVRTKGSSRWMLMGHSMGAKIATVIARWTEDAERGLSGLAGLVLLAGSPPTPEPMSESRRQTMMTWFAGGAETSLAQAADYVEKNLGGELEAALKQQAVEDVLRMNRDAWLAWLSGGSKEDWSERIGVLRTPALIVAGEKDEDLGAEGQRRLMLPHFESSRIEIVAGAKHLLPMERPEEVAKLIAEAAEIADGREIAGPVIDPEYRALIASDRVSPRTREVLLARARPDDPAYEPMALSINQLNTLRAVVDRVVPQRLGAEIDLAARIEQRLEGGKGDGWRYDLLPADLVAYRSGLQTLDFASEEARGKSFHAIEDEQKDELLTRAAAGKLGASMPRRLGFSLGIDDEVAKGLLTAEQMRMWFEDVRDDAVKQYVGHPATLARMGYSGIADGADAATMQGFVQLGPGEREPWEPRSLETGSKPAVGR